MKRPKKPYISKEPVKPNKTFMKSNRIYFSELMPQAVRGASVQLRTPTYFSVADLLDKLPKDVPLKDIRIKDLNGNELYNNRYGAYRDHYDYDYDYDNDYGDTHCIEYYTEEENLNFEQENVAYQEKKKKYDAEYNKKKDLIKQYKVDKTAYDLFVKEEARKRTETLLQQKEKRLQDELKKVQKSRDKLK